MVDYWPQGTPSGTLATLLAVGTPGENLGTISDAGAAAVITVDLGNSTLGIHKLVQQGATWKETPETSDLIGDTVALVNRAPNRPADEHTLLLAAGAPTEDLTHSDTGAVKVFPFAGTGTSPDVLTTPGTYGVPAATAASTRFGSTIGATTGGLLIATRGTSSVFGLTWGTVLHGTGDATATYPGTTQNSLAG